jgi:hypothetical protein
MKKGIWIVVGVILALAIAGGSFYGGLAYQRNINDQANRIRDEFLQARGLDGSGDNPGGFPGGSGAPGAGRGGFGGGVAGQVKSIDGNTLILSAGQNETRVTLSDTTSIEKTAQGVLSDLQPGMWVMVTGQRDAKGNLAAVQITILREGQFMMVTPAP